MTRKKLDAVVIEPLHHWYILRYEDGTMKETRKSFKYVSDFMNKHECTCLIPGVRYGFYSDKPYINEWSNK